MNHTFIGIDFGTTKTLVSVYSEQKRDARIIRLGRGRDDIPTSVYAAEDGTFLCGDDAEDLRAAEPMRYARAFKMKLGSQEAPLAYPEGAEFKRLTAMELARVFLSHVRSECEHLTGKQIKRAVITRPVRFSPQQCKQLEDAARVAGFEELMFITEPEAAARTYCRHQVDDLFTNALIIDWGGGTLDMALVSRKDGQITTYTKYTNGIPRGGENFDDALYHLVQERFSDNMGICSRLDGDMLKPEFNYSIRKNLRSAKEMLSRLQQHSLRLSGSTGAYPAVKVQRSEFVQVIQEDIEKAAKMACDLIKSISDPRLKPDRLILVGGSSRIPAVADILKKRTGLPCHTWDMSVEAVGLGAALVAAERWGEDKDVPPKMIPKNTNREKVDGDKVMFNRSYYESGLAYLHGVGVKEDYVRAADSFRKGYDEGDLNASYMYCHCLREGIGVPRNYDFAYQIAEYLAVKKNFYPAYYFMVDAYRTGRGADVDMGKAERYSCELEAGCKMPLKGVDEILRYDALLCNEASKPNRDWQRMERLARANMRISNWPQRYGWLALSLLFQNDRGSSRVQELRSVLDEGIKNGDKSSYFFKSLGRAQIAVE